MTEYPNTSMDFSVSNPDLQQYEQESATLLAVELKKAKKREEKLKTALYAVFPLDIYTKVRSDIEEAFDGDTNQIIEYFVREGINEIDLKEESQKNKLGLYQHVKEAASLLAAELKVSREREEKLKAALQKVFPINVYIQARPDVEASCDGEKNKILDHFLERGIDEIDINKERDKAAYRTTGSCLRNINFSEISKSRLEADTRRLSLIKTKGTLSNLKANQYHEFAIKHTLVHYKSNSVGTWIPKNGCSNLRYSVSQENGAISNIEEIEWIHRNNDCFNASTKEALQADYTFIILRNPFKRLLSFFLDKLCHLQQDQSEGSYNHAQEVFHFTGDNSFSDFVNYIWESPNSIYDDEHARPQCDFLLYQKYDDYFALEEIKDANQKIYEKTGLKIDDVRDKNSIFTSKDCEYSQDITSITQANKIKDLLDANKIPVVENMYTNDMIKKVATLYLQDILLYCNEIQSDVPELSYWIQRAITEE